MAQQALYRKWRSRSFDELIGQPHVVQTLQNALETGRVAHAYIFAGPRGTGKTSTARILAKAVNCLAAEGQRPCNECVMCRSINDGSALDLIEIDAASNTQVDKVRDVIVEKVNFAPTEARKKVYIIDEVHMLSNSAFNALLKTLEEPPPHAMFILATTEIHKLPATILSRCQRLDLRRISIPEVVEHLRWILQNEGVTADDNVLELVARQGTGSMRDALSLLDQLMAYGGDHLTLDHARAALGLASTDAVHTLVQALVAQEVPVALRLVAHLVDNGADPRQFLVDVLDYLRSLLLMMAGGGQKLLDMPDEQYNRLRQQMKYLDPAALVEMIRLFNQAGADLKLGLQPTLPLELAIVEAVLALQQRGMKAAPAADLTLPERAEAPAPRRRERPTIAGADGNPPASPQPVTVNDNPPMPTPPRNGVAESEQQYQIADPAPLTMDLSYHAAPDPAPMSGGESFGEPVAAYGNPPSSAPTPDPIAEIEVEETLEPAPTEAVAAERYTSPVEILAWWREQWDNFKAFLSRQSDQGARTVLRLKYGEPIAATADSLTLGFVYNIHLEKVQSPLEQRTIEDGLAQYCRRPVRLHFQKIAKDAPPPAAPATRFEQAEADPLVQEGLRQGGRLLNVTTPTQRKE